MELNTFNPTTYTIYLYQGNGWSFFFVTDIVLVIKFSRLNKLRVPNFIISVFGIIKNVCQFCAQFSISPIALNAGRIMDS